MLAKVNGSILFNGFLQIDGLNKKYILFSNLREKFATVNKLENPHFLIKVSITFQPYPGIGLNKIIDY